MNMTNKDKLIEIYQRYILQRNREEFLNSGYEAPKEVLNHGNIMGKIKEISDPPGVIFEKYYKEMIPFLEFGHIIELNSFFTIPKIKSYIENIETIEKVLQNNQSLLQNSTPYTYQVYQAVNDFYNPQELKKINEKYFKAFLEEQGQDLKKIDTVAYQISPLSIMKNFHYSYDIYYTLKDFLLLFDWVNYKENKKILEIDNVLVNSNSISGDNPIEVVFVNPQNKEKINDLMSTVIDFFVKMNLENDNKNQEIESISKENKKVFSGYLKKISLENSLANKKCIKNKPKI